MHLILRVLHFFNIKIPPFTVFSRAREFSGDSCSGKVNLQFNLIEFTNLNEFWDKGKNSTQLYFGCQFLPAQ